MRLPENGWSENTHKSWVGIVATLDEQLNVSREITISRMFRGL